MEEKRCIFCFLSDRNQKKMQKYSQIQEEKYEDILIIFDYPMYSKAAVVLAKIARENKAKILLFTDSDNAPSAEYSDILYKVKLNGISVFNSLISTQILIEYLLTYISQFIEEKAKIRFSKIRKYLIEKL